MTRQRLSRLPRAAVILLLGFLLTRVAGFMSYPLIALYATNHGGFGLSELGFLMGLPPAVSLTLSIPCGLLADRLGGRAMIILSILAATLAYGVLASAQEPGLMYLAVILIGVYRASFNAPGMVILGLPELVTMSHGSFPCNLLPSTSALLWALSSERS